LPVVPADVPLLWEKGIKGSLLTALPLRDAAGRLAAFGTRITVPSAATELLLAGVLVDEFWLISVPGQGSLFMHAVNNEWPLLRDTLVRVDLLRREVLLEISKRFNEAYEFSDTFMISALKGSGVDDLRKKIAGLMPAGPWLYPEDQAADVQMRFMASEVTREKIYLRLHEELPYSSTVETETWEEQKDGSLKIGQVIYGERDSQKAIVLGKGGQMIKLLGQLAREELEKSFERRVHLFLFVKVRENWTEDPERLRMMGLEN